jgi:hypothetical protein
MTAHVDRPTAPTRAKTLLGLALLPLLAGAFLGHVTLAGPPETYHGPLALALTCDLLALVLLTAATGQARGGLRLGTATLCLVAALEVGQVGLRLLVG